MSIKKDLVSLANRLDRLGLVREADLLDRLLPKMAAFLPWDGVEAYEDYEKREGPKRDADYAAVDKYKEMLFQSRGMSPDQKSEYYGKILSQAYKEGMEGNNHVLMDWIDRLIADYSKAKDSEEEFGGGTVLERLLSYPEYQGFSADHFKKIVALFMRYMKS